MSDFRECIINPKNGKYPILVGGPTYQKLAQDPQYSEAIRRAPVVHCRYHGKGSPRLASPEGGRACVENPVTHYPILVGGPTYNRLASSGMAAQLRSAPQVPCRYGGKRSPVASPEAGLRASPGVWGPDRTCIKSPKSNYPIIVGGAAYKRLEQDPQYSAALLSSPRSPCHYHRYKRRMQFA
ncbi:hypothetical protein Gasu2_33690 [Galdieria sulphuraria]|uniref:Uncharacterized protein n=1 Tax=Galdieria sulphuraria TaxID=130081 RepID=M2XRE0_GALSU|nr:uncharacterized protein Gasu_63400 [Galdieria sulphuraria]EME26004.1 hypothetical protein Gasu_63400 [Galdieria sulphuraria]GJD09098.1 hypothetical protein Gasu2_33690 [Galdieria sulphuraria]|eukprot:XP_005702524.1 hypothetical protein Gasu_63400 [Galdieria sulphuraria]